MLSLLFKQPFNYWRSTSVMYRIQSVLVFGLIIVYAVTRLLEQYKLWGDQYQITMSAASNLTLHIAILFICVSTPFILLYLLPRQKSITIFLDKPLTKIQGLPLIGFYVLKYYLITFIAFLPAFAAMSILNFLWGAASLFALIVYTLLVLVLNISLFFFLRNKAVYLFSYFIGFLIWFSAYMIFYWANFYYWIYDVISIPLLIILSIVLYKKVSSFHPQVLFNSIRSASTSTFWRKSRFKNIPVFLPQITQVLFNKEFVSLWRNPRYIRLKLFTLLAQIFISFFIIYYVSENAVLYLTLVAATLIWLHYGSYFSDKYVLPDSHWFNRILPLRFSSLFIAKFLSEFIFIIMVLSISMPFILSTAIEMSGFIQVMIILFIYSLVVLTTMINFQMMFYENPRYAGYVYHFSVIFFVVMSVNYRLVGPLMTLYMMGYYFYKNYKYFKT